LKFLTFKKDIGSQIGLVFGDDFVLDISQAGSVVPSARILPHTLRELLELGEDGLNAARGCLEEAEGAEEKLKEAGALLPIGGLSLLPPVLDPKLILSVGLNYWKHLEEMAGTPVPKHPAAFIKTRDSLLGSGLPIQAPSQCPDMIDYEGEFCLVMGKLCHNVSADEAMDYVAGYTIANDVSARNWVHEVFSAEGTFPAIHAWERNINGKQLPGFTPCGPLMVTKDEISDPQTLQMETRLNGEIMQSTKTDDMIFKLPELIAYFSQWYRFNPGDIITTGSPAGVGFGRDPKVFMKPGDIVEVEVEGIGVLTNSIA